ncbi:apolipoprotein N-acyltransferase [Leekyejoonella antrihumi]|uniref:Apolipoprotein N-acyltransferase n=1 Tax=Leekyejoonella antrihumi TaxID=1660198 RepID=A0A563E3T3_9MICO|nr:apolipoprotein N-acyltransferase [Leekyejoonella antrihumi]TWP36892.1 apolipoprotein N-acyltransferase [Leekyejoonella antrihumi]
MRLALAVCAGLCLWLSFPDLNVWPLAIVGVALLALATRGARARTGFLLGLVCGLAYFLPVLKWAGTYVGSFPWIALSVTEALYMALMGAACSFVQSARRIERLPHWLSPADGPHVRPFAIALLWLLQEAVRGSMPFGGFPWARLAWSQAGTPLAHLASIAGAPGLSFAVALAGGGLAVSLDRLRRGTPSGMMRRLAPAAAVVVLVPLSGVVPTPTGGPKMNVVGIQGDVPTAGLEFNAQRRAVLDDHVRETDVAIKMVRAGEIPQPDLVVWPENSSDIDPTRNPDAATEIIQAVNRVKAPLIVGAVLQQPSPDVSNASLLYEPGKGIVATYIKQHPVPFAEYIPYRSFFRFFSKKVDLVRADFAAGHKTGLFTIPTKNLGPVKVGPVICFEVAYDSLVHAAVAKGAQLLVVQTNNATFGYTAESEQQLAISRIRAIETGRSVVHISTVGVSGLITPDGTVHDKSRLFTAKVLSGALPLRSSMTLADRLGRLPEIVGSAAALVLLLLAYGGTRIGETRHLSRRKKEVHEVV